MATNKNERPKAPKKNMSKDEIRNHPKDQTQQDATRQPTKKNK